MLTHPPLIEADSGDPITSEAWNNLVQSIKTLYEAANKPLGTLVVQLLDQKTSEVVTGAVVSLLGDEGQIRSAQFVGSKVGAYVAPGLPAGQYQLVVEAEDYAPEDRQVTIGEDGAVQRIELKMKLSVEEITMPNLFGFTVSQAQQSLGNHSLSLGRIIDSHGIDIPPAAVPPELLGARVLNQVPEAGLPVPLKQPVQLHISARTEVKPSVKVPNLSGMTYEQAKAALEAVGLTIAAPVTGGK